MPNRTQHIPHNIQTTLCSEPQHPTSVLPGMTKRTPTQSPTHRQTPCLYIVILSLTWMLWSQASVAQIVYKSTTEPVVLLELYTSEGCSSCPPADRWFSELTEVPGLWKTLFPISFHVDYWDYLGWDDPFASSAWSMRQRRHARLGNTKGIYTPGMLASGREWHGWRKDYQPPRFQPHGTLTLRLSEKTGQFTAGYDSDQIQKEKQNTDLKVALLGFGLETEVKAGENRGRLLKHDFVVLDVVSQNSESGFWSGKIPVSPFAKFAKRLAIVAWISTQGDQRPVQITGGWFPPPTRD